MSEERRPGSRAPRNEQEAARCARMGHALTYSGLPQEEVAARLGVTPSHLSGVKNAKYRVSPSLAYKMEEQLGIEARWIMTGTGPMEKRAEGDVYVDGHGAFADGRVLPASVEPQKRVTWHCGNCGAELGPALQTCYRCGSGILWGASKPPSNRL